MSEQKHTPGPWKAGMQGKSWRVFAFDGTCKVAKCFYMDGQLGPIPEAEANARLIGQAPKMKELLERLARIGDMAGWNDIDPLKLEAQALLRRIGGE